MSKASSHKSPAIFGSCLLIIPNATFALQRILGFTLSISSFYGFVLNRVISDSPRVPSTRIRCLTHFLVLFDSIKCEAVVLGSTWHGYTGFPNTRVIFILNSSLRCCWMENIVNPSSEWTSEGWYSVDWSALCVLRVLTCLICIMCVRVLICSCMCKWFLFLLLQSNLQIKDQKYPHIVNVEQETALDFNHKVSSLERKKMADLEGL